MTALHVYQVGPIDWWGGWTPLPELLARPNAIDDPWPHSGRSMQARWEFAQTIARHLGWPGDIRQGPFACPLPNGDIDCGEYLIAWKEDNNGTTYVASPYRLPWLEGGNNRWANYPAIKKAKRALNEARTQSP
jgi:hypothetical protein